MPVIRIFTLFAVFVLLITSTNAQTQSPGSGNTFNNGLLPNVVNPSPEAASLGKFGVWPVSQYTGAPNISVPVYTISTGGFDLPISLSYHAGGVKVDDMSSWVGVNWALNAGGMIARTVVGLPDDDAYGFAALLRSGVKFKSSYDFGNNQADYYFLKKEADNPPTGDTEADIYYYNFAGTSGKFFMDSTLNMHTIPVSNLQFLYTPFSYLQGVPQPAGFSNGGWMVADDKGNIYKFLNTETTRAGIGAEGSQNGGNAYTTGYYLSQIILANKVDTINFIYGNKSEIYNLPATQSCKSILNEPISPRPVTGVVSYSDVLNANKILYNGSPYNSSSVKKFYTTGTSTLNAITWRGGKINFYANTSRQDMTLGLGKMLDSIAVFDINNNKITSYSIGYAYIANRYFLNTLTQYSKDYIDSKSYSFEYNNAAGLPPRNFSVATYYCPQDHWGYYNKALSNTCLLPPNANMPYVLTSILNGYREPDTVAMQYGTLNKITYPTKGYTTFVYEANRYDPSTPIDGGNPTNPIITLNKSVQCDTLSPYARSVNFTVPFSQNNASLQISVSNYSHPPSKGVAPLTYVKLMQGSQQIYYTDAFASFPANATGPDARGLYNYSVTIPNIQLNTGSTYTLTVSDTCPTIVSCSQGIPMPYMAATIVYSGYGTAPPIDTTSLPALPIAGGLRIKQISNYTSDGTFSGRKIYDYSPGNLIIYPKDYVHYYDVDVRDYATNPGFTNVFAKMIEETNTSQTILGFTQGSTVGYTNVKERDVDESNTDVGFTNYIFSNYKDSLNILNYDFNYWRDKMSIVNSTIPANSFDFKRGLLLYKAVYKRNGQNYFKIDSVSNDYNFNEYTDANFYYRQHNLRVSRLRFFNDWGSARIINGYRWPCGASNLNPGDTNPNDCITDSLFTTPDFSYSFYDNITGWIQQVSSTEIHYDQNGANPVTTTTTYNYNNKNLLVNNTTSSNSKGEKEITNISFPVDYTIGGASNSIAQGIQLLQNANIIGAPVEKIVQKSNTDGSNLRTVAASFTQYNPAIPKPTVLYTTASGSTITDFTPASVNATSSTIDNRYQPRAFFNIYDKYGNILEQQKTSDVKEVYLWGYNAQYPVAKIVGNISYSSVLTQSGIDTTQLRNPASDAALRSYLNSLRSISGVLIYTYTYAPLVGMTSETDPRGNTIYYEYDGFGRLIDAKDKDGNVIKKYNYHYQGQ